MLGNHVPVAGAIHLPVHAEGRQQVGVVATGHGPGGAHHEVVLAGDDDGFTLEGPPGREVLLQVAGVAVFGQSVETGHIVGLPFRTVRQPEAALDF